MLYLCVWVRPESLSDSKIYGIELDSISGRIAQQLYQNSGIAVQGFEKTDLPDSFFDAVSTLGKVSPYIGVFFVHGALAGNESHDTARTHFVQRPGKAQHR